jgi:hypothetical protein
MINGIKHLRVFIGIILLFGWGKCCVTSAVAEEVPQLSNMPHANYDDTGRKLPAGVPREVDTNGKVVYINHHFTTPAYQRKALELVVQEANQVAQELNLPEELPITESNLVEYHVSPFGFAYAYKMIGNVTTKHYIYYVSRDDKFSQLDIAEYDQACLRLMTRGSLSIDKIDTNAAIRMATNWLGRISIDVAKLNQECISHVAVSPYWNGLSHLGDKPRKTFVPIYYVWWTYPNEASKGQGSAAGVELFTPTKILLQLSIEDPKYILRKQIEFTNFADLFPGSALIRTNYPVKSVIINQSFWK